MAYFRKCLIATTLLALMTGQPSVAQVNTFTETEPVQLGMMAGIAYACKAGKKLDDYELIAGRIMANKAIDPETENLYLEEYVRAKRTAMQRQQKQAPMSCPQFLKEFEKQEIFKCTVYSDGSVKTPDGQWLRPRGYKPNFKGKH